MTLLWLARHAEPLIPPGVCYGKLDVAADGAATARCAQALATVLPASLTMVASPLQRCEQLRQSLLGVRADLTSKTDPRLQEMGFGAWEGQRWADIDPAELTAWTDDFNGYAAGGSGESVAAFMARVAAAMDELDRTQDTLWLTHAGVIRAATLIATGQRHIQLASQWPAEAPAFGQWVTLAI
jgi:alpha-ribazole phosphatase